MRHTRAQDTRPKLGTGSSALFLPPSLPDLPHSLGGGPPRPLLKGQRVGGRALREPKRRQLGSELRGLHNDVGPSTTGLTCHYGPQTFILEPHLLPFPPATPEVIPGMPGREL